MLVPQNANKFYIKLRKLLLQCDVIVFDVLSKQTNCYDISSENAVKEARILF